MALIGVDVVQRHLSWAPPTLLLTGHKEVDAIEVIIIIISFIGFGSQKGWITTDIKTYITNSKAMMTGLESVGSV